MINIQKKQNEINEINNQKMSEKQKIENLNKKINQCIIENELKQKEIDELRKNNNDIKDKGKNLLKKYDENINKNSDEIIELKNTIKDREKQIEKAKVLYHNLEQFKILIENKLEEKSNRINTYLSEISDLNQKNRILKTKYEELKTEYDKINIDFCNSQENNINLNHSKNNFNNSQVIRKNQTKKISNKMNSKFGMNNNINNNLSNAENLKYKKLYEELKKKYDTTLKNISCGKKIKSIQDLFEKLDITEKDLNECRRIMNSSFNKIQDILSKDIFISEISNQPFDFNLNNSFESNIEQKFFVIFEKFVEFHMLRENQIKNLKEQNEVLNQNIHLNQDKKELFELNYDNDNKNINKILSNTIYKSMAKNRRGYLFKDLSTNTKKIFEGYNKENPEILDLNKINNINSKNNLENGIRIADYQGMNNLRDININKNMINSKENSNINNIINSNGNNINNNFGSKKLNINFNILKNDNQK